MNAVRSQVRPLLVTMLVIMGLTIWQAAARAEDPAASQAALVAALSKSKVSLADGIRQATKAGDVAISAKFEFDDAGKLSLSVYTAEKGLAVPPEENVLKELSGSPEQSPWNPEVEVFKDVPHTARSAEQLTLMSLSRLTLLDVINRAQKSQPGTVFSVTPEVKQHKAVAMVLVTRNGKVTERSYNLLAEH
jgi:hypothetical protein